MFSQVRVCILFRYRCVVLKKKHLKKESGSRVTTLRVLFCCSCTGLDGSTKEKEVEVKKYIGTCLPVV